MKKSRESRHHPIQQSTCMREKTNSQQERRVNWAIDHRPGSAPQAISAHFQQYIHDWRHLPWCFPSRIDSFYSKQLSTEHCADRYVAIAKSHIAGLDSLHQTRCDNHREETRQQQWVDALFSRLFKPQASKVKTTKVYRHPAQWEDKQIE